MTFPSIRSRRPAAAVRVACFFASLIWVACSVLALVLALK